MVTIKVRQNGSLLVEGEDGPIGWLPGYAGLYRAWVNAVAARAKAPVVLICEARQIGEALVAPAVQDESGPLVEAPGDL